jgi:outer membrane protein
LASRRALVFEPVARPTPAPFQALKTALHRIKVRCMLNLQVQTRLLSLAVSTMNMKKNTLALAVMAVFCAAAQAQSLGALYEAARDYDATYQAARAQAEAAQHRLTQSQSLRKPSVGLTGSATQNLTNPPNNTVLTTAGPVGTGDSVSSRTLQAGVGAEQWLYNRSNLVTITQAEKSVIVAQTDVSAAEQDLIVRLSQAYVDVLVAQDTLGAAQAAKKAIAEQLASAKRNFEVGTATITDTREAQARFDLATAQEIAADNDLRIKRIALDQLVGKTGVTPKPLATPVALPAVTPPSVDVWVGTAETAPSVRRAQLGLDVANLEFDKAQAATSPTVKLTGSAGGSNSVGSGISTAGRGTATSISAGVQLAMPLYTGGATQGRVQETAALREQSRNNLDAAKRGVAQATRQAFFGLQSGQAQVTALEAAEASSKLALEATQLGYRVGVRVNLDVLNAQTQLFNTQRDLSKARYDVVMANLRLRQAAGNLSAADIQAVDALLVK